MRGSTMLKWKDATSYDRFDKERTPRVYELCGHGERIVIHRIHGCPGWYITSHAGRFRDRRLDTDGETGEHAKEAARKYLIDYAQELVERFERLLYAASDTGGDVD